MPLYCSIGIITALIRNDDHSVPFASIQALAVESIPALQPDSLPLKRIIVVCSTFGPLGSLLEKLMMMMINCRSFYNSNWEFQFTPSILLLSLFISLVHAFCLCTPDLRFLSISDQRRYSDTVDDIHVYIFFCSCLSSLSHSLVIGDGIM